MKYSLGHTSGSSSKFVSKKMIEGTTGHKFDLKDNQGTIRQEELNHSWSNPTEHISFRSAQYHAQQAVYSVPDTS